MTKHKLQKNPKSCKMQAVCTSVKTQQCTSNCINHPEGPATVNTLVPTFKT